MNAVEIEEAVSDLVVGPFDSTEFPLAFIAAFGAKKTTIDRLRRGDSNQSDADGVLWRGNIHIAVAPGGEVGPTLAALRTSPKTAAQKAKFILVTDGETLEAEDLIGGDVIACAFADLPRHFATFLPLAGISTVKEIKNNPIDVKATGRLNKLYVTLLNDNPEWATEERRPALNQFMARLIFCFFAEDTGIFNGEDLFTATITKMSQPGHGRGAEQWGNTHDVLQHLFLAMDTPVTHEGRFDDRYRRAAGIRPYADIFPYVNGGLFKGADECPRFSRTARAFLLNAGALDWKEINPDIFGSMIQAVADDGERGELGMHYTSVPNILKVLNPLFLDGLREQLEAAGDSRQKLRNLRKRLATIRVFDPACGSGNFLVIAYKQMREIEAAIVERLGGEANLKLEGRRSVIPLSNFYGIEIKDFAAEIARLALLIAEFQADCLYLSQQEARAMVLPLHKTGQITVGNALRLDWLEVCPPMRTASGAEQDLGGPTGRLALEANGIDDSAEAETYICGNPPYLGSTWQSPEQKEDLQLIFQARADGWKSLDYVAGWFIKAADYGTNTRTASAFVSTNSICQGQQVPILWPLIFATRRSITFARLSFKWANLASHNAGVTVVIVGISGEKRKATLFSENSSGEITATEVDHINAYLVAGADLVVNKASTPICALPTMDFGSKPADNGGLLLTFDEAEAFAQNLGDDPVVIRRFQGSEELIQGKLRYCLWIDENTDVASISNAEIKARLGRVRASRLASPKAATRADAARPHRFAEVRFKESASVLAIPRVSSENRDYLPVAVVEGSTVIGDRNFAIYEPPLWAMALIASRMHWVWIGTVCVRMRTDFSYSNTLGWNTFPLPRLTAQDKADLTRTAENILLAREAHFPATIADLYDPDAMPDDLRRAHEENDEVLERIYIGRRFRNDTERLEKLFDLYTRMSADVVPKAKARERLRAGLIRATPSIA